jgi:hypothetical protein
MKEKTRQLGLALLRKAEWRNHTPHVSGLVPSMAGIDIFRRGFFANSWQFDEYKDGRRRSVRVWDSGRVTE